MHLKLRIRSKKFQTPDTEGPGCSIDVLGGLQKMAFVTRKLRMDWFNPFSAGKEVQHWLKTG